MSTFEYKTTLTFFLDGEKTILKNVDPSMRLIDFLHLPEVGKAGTKIGCGQGGCGACTVMLTSYDHGTDQITNKAINACLRPLATLDGTMITTTQGIGSVKQSVDETQWQIAANNGSQCGYCTPGFVMNMFTRMQEETKPTVKEVNNLFDGNICRCTGYRPILEGFKKLASDYQKPEKEAEIKIDPNYKPKEKDPKAKKIVIPSCFNEYMKHPDDLRFEEGDMTYFRPMTLMRAMELLKSYGPIGSKAQLMSGNTAIGIYPTRNNYAEAYQKPNCLIDISGIKELQSFTTKEDTLTLGGQITISRLLELLKLETQRLDKSKTTGLKALYEHLTHVANLQVRNEASLAGNIYIATNKGFLSDLVLVLATLEARVKVVSSEGDTTYPILELPTSEKLPKDALYHSIHIPLTDKRTYIKTFKIRRRDEDCHAIVNAGFSITLNENNFVESSRMVANGIDAQYNDTTEGLKFKPILLDKVSTIIAGKSWDEKTLKIALSAIQDSLSSYAPPNNEEGQPYEIDQIPFEYRCAQVLSLFYKSYIHVCEQKGLPISERLRSVNTPLHEGISTGMQSYNSYAEELPVSAPFVKLSAFMQATGEATYTSSVITPPKTLEAAFVYSMISKGTFFYKLPDDEKATELENLIAHLKNSFDEFVDIVSYRDIKEGNRTNNWGGLAADDPLFVPAMGEEIPSSVLNAADGFDHFFPKQTTTIGAPLAIVLAKSEQKAQEIADFVRQYCIGYKEEKAITIEEALKTKHYFPQAPKTNLGMTHIEHMAQLGNNPTLINALENLTNGSSVAEPNSNFVSGEQRTGYQNHFYMETMTALAVPGEQRDITIYSTTQNLADDQKTVAEILGLNVSDVRVMLYREGGGFGGRQSRARFVSGPVAIASEKHNCPVRMKLSREANFIMCGNRHPFYGKFASHYEPSGKIKGLVVDYASNGGNTYDMSFPVMDLSVLSSDNVYNIENLKITGNVCQTNEISSTAFRAFGLVQSMNILEECIEKTAFECGIEPEALREKNFYKDGQVAWTSFEVTSWTLAVLRKMGFDEDTIEKIQVLKNKQFEDEKALDQAIESNQISGLLGPANIDKRITLKNFSTQSYDYTPYLTGLKWNNINRLWNDIKVSSDFEKRKSAIARFNAENKWKKRGISMIPLKYGISFNGPRGVLNQAGAYITAYAGDASVLVHHGGVEMGQGIHTKMAQIAAETLGIPIEYIKMAETDTNVISDASATAASTGSDLNGGAVQMACLGLRKRLEEMCENLEEYSLYFAESDLNNIEKIAQLNLKSSGAPMDTADIIKVRTIIRNWRDHWAEVWPIIIEWAYSSRINLSESARYKAPHHEVVDNTHDIGRPFFYYTYSVAVSEVEVDILTGEFETLRSDILFDVGKSLNPLIDVGQIEGGFVQGLGYLTTEELIKQKANQVPIKGIPKGAITSVNTWDYKPPGAKSIPKDFRVSIFDDRLSSDEQQDPVLAARAVKSSKGIGEPPLVLANSVFFAIKRAILAFYKETGYEGWVELTAPATTAKIQSACHVAIKDMTLSDQEKLAEV